MNQPGPLGVLSKMKDPSGRGQQVPQPSLGSHSTGVSQNRGPFYQEETNKRRTQVFGSASSMLERGLQLHPALFKVKPNRTPPSPFHWQTDFTALTSSLLGLFYFPSTHRQVTLFCRSTRLAQTFALVRLPIAGTKEDYYVDHGQETGFFAWG